MTERAINDHYSVDDLGERIVAALAEAGANVDSLTIDDLAPVDAFHIRGRAATEELAEWAAVRADERVLDVGSGVGGAARYLAATCGCSVTGIDLTDAYCRAAEMLSTRAGLGERTTFQRASALDMPFPDDTFDVVWTEHVQMNIEDKDALYAEMRRVVAPGGRLVFHDILAGPTPGLHLPVPWATAAAMSHLIAPDDLRRLLERLGFEVVRWVDVTEPSIAFFREVASRPPHPVGLHLLMGAEAPGRFANVLRNLEDDRLRVVQAVLHLG
jgi:SAM-dependent methyltransferase